MTMNEVCDDNRFEVIARAKEHIIESTNIEASKDEMECLDNLLFRCWQMGWLKQYESTPENSNKWIPVSERLPEKTGLYLISFGDLVTSKSFDGHNFITISGIRLTPDAWMPLPEPYEQQESEG